MFNKKSIKMLTKCHNSATERKFIVKNKCLAIVAAFGCIFTQQVYAAQAVPSQEDIISKHIQTENYGKVIQTSENKETAELSDEKGFYVSKFDVSYSDSIGVKKESKLRRVISKHENKKISLNDLTIVVREINAFFRSHGYPAATAYIPEQNSTDGKIKICVELGKYGSVKIENNSNVDDKIVSRLVASIRNGETVHNKKLETAIYNINDLGGVRAGGYFKPGKNVGESDIIIKVEDINKDTYTIYTENYGSKNSGRYRYNLAGEWINKAGAGEKISVNGSVSNQRQHNYGVQYEQLIAKNGTKASITVSRSDYELGSQYSAIGATGKSTNLGINFSTPLWKTGLSNMSVNYGWAYRDLQDELREFTYRVKKHSNSAYAGISGKEQIQKTLINYDIIMNTGRLTCDEASVAGVPFEISSEGKYTKGVATVNMNHYFDKHFNLLVKGQAQQASRLLDSSEQFYLGGAKGVRAYPQGEGSGDEGYQATAELFYNTKLKGIAFSAFFDIGHVKYAVDNSISGGTTLKGWGLGMSYNRSGYWARLDYARRIGLANDATESAKSKQRMWFVLGKQW